MDEVTLHAGMIGEPDAVLPKSRSALVAEAVVGALAALAPTRNLGVADLVEAVEPVIRRALEAERAAGALRLMEPPR